MIINLIFFDNHVQDFELDRALEYMTRFDIFPRSSRNWFLKKKKETGFISFYKNDDKSGCSVPPA